jgi:hypothetical protein
MGCNCSGWPEEEFALREMVIVEVPEGVTTGGGGVTDALQPPPQPARAKVMQKIAAAPGVYAAYTLMPADSSVLTVEDKLNLLAPADGEELTARARVLRSGRTLKICAADVHAKKNGKEVYCATMLATIMCLPEKSDRAG